MIGENQIRSCRKFDDKTNLLDNSVSDFYYASLKSLNPDFAKNDTLKATNPYKPGSRAIVEISHDWLLFFTLR